SGPPNPADPTALIKITVHIRDDDTSVAGVIEPGFSNVETILIKPPVATPPDPFLPPPGPEEPGGTTLPQLFDRAPLTTVPVVATAQSQTPDIRSGGGDVAATSERYFVLVIVNPDGTLGDRFRLEDE